MTRPLALIAGAGIAGLTAAWWLDRIGWRSLVVERRPDLFHSGYMMGLSGPGYGTASRMGIEPQLRLLSTEIDDNVYLDGGGREIVRLRYRDFIGDLPYLALLRTDLVRVLREALPPTTELRFSTSIEGFREDGDRLEARLSDGRTVTPSLIIGADGLRSPTRRLLFGEDRYRALGYRFAVYDIPGELEEKVDFVSYVEPGHMVEYYRLGDERLAALHVWKSDETGEVPPGERWALLDAISEGMHPLVRGRVALMRDAPPPVIDDLLMVDLPRWSTGSVTLLGDAAHSLTLVSGQGGGMAMASAERLALALSRHDHVPDALAEHGAAMRHPILRLQQRTLRTAKLYVPTSALAFRFRNALLRHMPRSWLSRYFSNAARSEIDLLAASKDGFSIQTSGPVSI